MSAQALTHHIVGALSLHHHGHVGKHAFIQLWNYEFDTDPWHLLVLWAPETEWNPHVVYEWGWTKPTHEQIGEVIDLWVKAPKHLKFLLL